MLLAEALLLLLLDDERGTTSDWVTAADQGLAGALLLDLDVEDRDGRLFVGSSAPSEPALAAAWTIVSAEQRRARDWVAKLPGRLKPIKATVASGLVERGVLDERRHRTLGVFKSVRYPALDGEPERELRARLREVLVAGAEPKPFEAELISILVPLDLVKRVVKKDERKAAAARAKEIAARGPVGDAVKAAVQEQVMAAVIAAGAAAAAGASAASAAS